MKKIFSWFLVFLIISTMAVGNKASAATYSDVPPSYGFYKEIMYLLDKGVISPSPKFGVNEKVTRAEVATMVSKAVGLNGEKTTTPFKDVPASHPASGYINSAVKAGIIKGYTPDTFKPTGIVNRGEMAIFLARTFKLETESTKNFKDMHSSMASFSSVKKIIAANITTGYADNTFRPNDTLTRGQISAFIARAMMQKESATTKDMNVHFIDVGQGDSILLQSPNGKTMLIDGGTRTAGSKVVNFIKSKGITKLDYVVASHPDSDHIGGLITVLEQVNVGTFMDSGKPHTTDTYFDLLEIVDAKNINFMVPKKGDFINLDSSLSIQVLNANPEATDNNDASIVLKVKYNNVSFLLTGDADAEIEAGMMKNYNVSATILKAGHHGSDSSTSEAFLSAVKPAVTILSYGKDNSYGHPHSEVVQRLKAVNSKMYSTAESGNITVKTNGSTYSVSAQPWSGGVIPQPDPTSDSLEIVSKNLETEVIAIKNNGQTSVNLKGWTLVSVEGNQTYTFPDYDLDSGATVYVTSGANAKEGGNYLKWTGSYIWNNDGDAAQLLDPQGVVVSELQ